MSHSKRDLVVLERQETAGGSPPNFVGLMIRHLEKSPAPPVSPAFQLGDGTEYIVPLDLLRLSVGDELVGEVEEVRMGLERTQANDDN